MMRQVFFAVVFVATGLSGTPAMAAPAAPTTAASTKARYTVAETDLGTLLDDPVSKAILAKFIPDIIANPNIEMGRALTLTQMQAYAGDMLSDEVLAKIQADLAAAAPKP